LEPLKTLTAKVMNRLDWTTDIKSIETVFKNFYYSISKKPRLWWSVWWSHASSAVNALW